MTDEKEDRLDRLLGNIALDQDVRDAADNLVDRIVGQPPDARASRQTRLLYAAQVADVKARLRRTI